CKRRAARRAAARAVAPEPELSERRPIRARLTREIADSRDLAEAAAMVLSEVVEGEEFSVPEDRSGFALSARLPDDRRRAVTISSLDNTLERAARGEKRFADPNTQVPDWVPIYPGPHSLVSRSPGTYLGFMAYMVDSSAGEIVDWYEDVAELIGRGGADPSLQAPTPVETVRMGPDGGVRERFAMKWGDRLVALVITEDEFGGSFLMLLFRD
ncbi:MAG: hypothetical protein OXG35_04750, partial [Acidobacteria bacterium]|nr:hypothetical protein [Acidobacteriota bacterium]